MIIKIKTFFKACWWGLLIGGFAFVSSWAILWGLGKTYAATTDVHIPQSNQFKAAGVDPAPIIENRETTKDQQVAQLIAELERTKEDLGQTKAALKSLTDHMVEHFISNYRDTITVVGAGIGIVAALLGGLIAWAYGLLKDGLTKKIKRETEEVHAAVVGKSESRLSYLIYKNLSYSFYRYYRVILDKPDHPGFKGGVELASWFAEATISHAGKAHDGEERDRLVADAKSHLLFHNACRIWIPESGVHKKEILDEAVTHYETIQTLDGNSQDLNLYSRDTIAWIFILLGDESRRKEGANILQSILGNPKMTIAYRKELEENYRKRGVDLTVLLWKRNDDLVTKYQGSGN
jgi:hypothetical protein